MEFCEELCVLGGLEDLQRGEVDDGVGVFFWGGVVFGELGGGREVFQVGGGGAVKH